MTSIRLFKGQANVSLWEHFCALITSTDNCLGMRLICAPFPLKSNFSDYESDPDIFPKPELEPNPKLNPDSDFLEPDPIEILGRNRRKRKIAATNYLVRKNDDFDKKKLEPLILEESKDL